MCLLQLQGGFAHPRTSAWPGSARAPPQRVKKAITHLSLKSIVVSGALCWDCCCRHVQAASPGWRQSPFLAVGGKVRFPPGMVQQRRRMLVLGAAGPQSCGFAPAPLSAPLHALLEKRGGLLFTPFCGAAHSEPLLVPTPGMLSHLLVFHTGSADRWESFSPACAVCRVSAAVQVSSRGKASPAQQLRVLRTILLCSPGQCSPSHWLSVLHPQAPPSFIPQKTFLHPLFPSFITSLLLSPGIA